MALMVVSVLALGSVYLYRKILPPAAPVPEPAPREALNLPAPVPQPPAAPQPAPTPQPRPKHARDLAYYETAAADAFRTRKCGMLRNVLDQGLNSYPDSSKLWGSEAGYAIVCRPDLSAAVRGQRALNAALRAYQLDSSDQNAVNVGWIYQSMAGDWYRALAYYEKGVRFADRDASLHYHMGQCYEALRNTPKAVESYQLFLRAAPNHQYAADARQRLSLLGG
jgi:tetratricopeptide (TPR) repeat protein